MRRPEAKDFLGKKIVKVDISEPHLDEDDTVSCLTLYFEDNTTLFVSCDTYTVGYSGVLPYIVVKNNAEAAAEDSEGA